ncbi:MAG TPA: GNAT family N-acetyltransferase [Steroidobacteraceae bacterium]|nr:GNAT family N-acetyltransferase [Steroidobacteraceae bacterium]
MPQVSVRDCRGEDHDWIQSVYRDYLMDLAPSATGLFPMLPEIGQRATEQLARLPTGQGAYVLTVCYAEARVGFARITAREPAAGAAASTAPPAAPAPPPRAPQPGPGSAGASGAPAASSGEFSMAEFFIARPWRRRGIGAQAVRLILDRFQGAWLITEHLRNEAAVRFWRQVVSAYTGGRYQERIVNGEVQQRFASGRRRER